MCFLGAMGVGSIAAHGQEGFGLFLNKEQIFGLTVQNNFQVRIQQRVIIRVPRYRVANTLAAGSGKSVSSSLSYKEEKLGKCLIMNRFVASRPGPGPKESLELFTREGALVRAYLGDGCLAREFYAGAYMERPADGKLCAERDFLYARTGAKCEIDKFRALVVK
jgi:hypothetical protein